MKADEIENQSFLKHEAIVHLCWTGVARLARARVARLAVGLRWNLVMQYWAKVRWRPPSTDAHTSFREIGG